MEGKRVLTIRDSSCTKEERRLWRCKDKRIYKATLMIYVNKCESFEWNRGLVELRSEGSMENEAVATKPLSLGGGGAAGAGRGGGGGGGDPESPVRSIPAVDPLSCITSLLASVLSSRTQVSTLPSSFCATLLDATVDDSGEEDHLRIEEGVPGHPLYAHLATALYQWIHSGEFPRSLPPMAGINEDDSWKAHMGEWSAIVTSFGSEMILVTKEFLSAVQGD